VADKKRNSKFGYTWAFVLGVLIMVGVYALFQGTAARNRGGSTDTIDTTTKEILTSLVPIVQTAGADDADNASVKPSAFLGVQIVSIDAVIAQQLGIRDGHGVLVNSVVPTSPAQKAGLLRGDVIAVLNTSATIDVDTFKEIMMTLNPGDNVRITYVRDGKKNRTYAELVESPAILQTADTTDTSDWGVSISPLSSALRDSLSIPDGITGVVILSVVPGGLANEAGLKAGDIITGIDTTPISDMDDFFGAIASDSDNTSLLDIYSQGTQRYVPIDASSIQLPDLPLGQPTLGQRVLSILTGGMPFADDEDDEDGPKGGKFAQDDVQLTSDTPAFNRPSTVPGDTNTGGTSSSSSDVTTGMNRPSSVPPQSGGPVNDTVLFIGLLLLAILYLAYREYHRPPETNKGR